MSKTNKHTKRHDRKQARALKQGIGLPDIDWESLIDSDHNSSRPYDAENIHDDGNGYDDRDYYR